MSNFYVDTIDSKPCKVYYLTENQVTLQTLRKISKAEALKLYDNAKVRFSAVAYSKIKQEIK